MQKLLLIFLVFCYSPSFSQEDISAFTDFEKKKFEYSKSKLQTALANNDSIGVAEHYYRLGKLLSFNNQVSISNIYFNRALSYLNSKPASFEKGRLMWRIATNEGILGNYSEAERMFRLSFETMRKAKSADGVARMSIPYAEYLIDSKKYSEAEVVILRALDLPRIDKSAAMVLKNILRKVQVHLNKKPVLNTQIEDYFEDKGEWPDAFYAYCIKLECYSNLKQKKEADEVISKLNQIEKDKIVPSILSKKMKLSALLEYYKNFGSSSEILNAEVEFKNAELEILRLDRESLKRRVSASEIGDESFAKMMLQEEELMKQNENLRSRNRLILILVFLIIFITIVSFLFFRLYKKQKITSLRNEILVKEQNHRVKNNLQTISSLLSLQKESSKNNLEFEKLVDESKMRIEAMAAVQRKLSDTNQQGISINILIKEIIQDILVAFGKTDIPFVFDSEEIILNPQKCTPLAIIINEITTNSCKYGLSMPNSEFHCILKRKPGVIEIIIGDNGPGFKNDSSKDSLGLQLIDLQTEQLNGKITLMKSLYKLTFPAHDKSINN
ncbi:MAG: sensor histidine kinase [Spirosomataceae bacterium]